MDILIIMLAIFLLLAGIGYIAYKIGNLDPYTKLSNEFALFKIKRFIYQQEDKK